MGGGKGGGGGGSSPKPSPYEIALANISQSYYQDTDLIRQAVFNKLASSLGYPNAMPAVSTGGGGGGGVVAPSAQPATTQIISPTAKAGGGDVKTYQDIINAYVRPDEPLSHYRIMRIRNGSAPPEVLNAVKAIETDASPMTEFKLMRMDKTPVPIPSTSEVSGNVPQGAYSGSMQPWDVKTDPLFSPTYMLAKEGIEDQYGVARENILSSMPVGGAQLGELGKLEIERASQEATLPAMISKDIITDMWNKAYGVATGSVPQATQGLSTAAGTYGTKQAAAMGAEAAENAAKYQGLGTVAGMGAAAAILK